MAHKGGLRHVKRLPSPWFWPIHRKEAAWAPKASPGAHKAASCLPLELIIRNSLNLAKTRKEAAHVLAQRKVRVDGRIKNDMNYAVGLMDVVEIPDANLAYRILPVEKRGISLIRIPKDEAKFKLCKILSKSTSSRGVIQYGTHDGRLIRATVTDGESLAYSRNDTLRLSIPAQRVLGHFRFERGNLALIVGGRNQGKSGKIIEFQAGSATRPAMVTIENDAGSRLDTMVDYTFVVGTDKPAIKLEAS